MEKFKNQNSSNHQGHSNNSSDSPAKEREADVLYQKLGGKWYAFSLVDDEVFMGAVTEEQIREFESDDSSDDSTKVA